MEKSNDIIGGSVRGEEGDRKEKQEFVTALAISYVKWKKEYDLKARYFIHVDVTMMFSEEFKVVRTLAEEAYKKWMMYYDGIELLPSDAKQAFNKEYERLLT